MKFLKNLIMFWTDNSDLTLMKMENHDKTICGQVRSEFSSYGKTFGDFRGDI